MIIRKATPEDAQALLDIYRPYIERTAITFEYEVPTVEEFKNRIETILEKYPYLVAQEEDGFIKGYTYAYVFKDRAAYDWSCETTIYVHEDFTERGIGTALYTALEQCLKQMGILNMNACIALPKLKSKHLAMDSIYFHEKMGFEKVGEFRNSGFKFGEWFHMSWFEKIIGDHTADTPDVKFGQWDL